MAPAELSAREAQVARLAAEDLTNEEIAARLGLSRRTVEAHLRMVFRKTGVSRRSQLAAGSRPVEAPAPSSGGVRSALRELERRLACASANWTRTRRR